MSHDFPNFLALIFFFFFFLENFQGLSSKTRFFVFFKQVFNTFAWIFLYVRVAAKIFVKKKTDENVKEELFKSLREKDEDEDKEINAVNNPTEATELINHFEKIIKTQHKQVRQYIYKQGGILKIFKKTEKFFDGTGQSRSTVYFKIEVYKLLKKPWPQKINITIKLF